MIYVLIQFAAILYLLGNTQFADLNALSYILIAIAAAVGVLAVVNMRLDNLNIRPALKPKHELRTIGIYRLIRHPMYASILLFCVVLLLSNPHYLAQIVMLILVIVLVLKSNAEEKLLSKRFPDYQIYRQKTGRFLPRLHK